MVLDILRKKAEDAETRLRQADSQLGSLRGHLRLRGVPVFEVADQYMDEYHAIDRAYGYASSGDCGEDGEAVDEEVDDKEDGGAEGSGTSDER